MGEWENLAIVLGAAYLPALLYLAKVRASERLGARENWGVLLVTFAYGALVSILIAMVLNPLLGTGLAAAFPSLPPGFALAVVAAPLVEEFAKAQGVLLARRKLQRPVDGVVYGASAALGFSATENLIYQVGALATGGTLAWILVVIARSISSSLVHPSATGITGYGIAWARIRGHPWPSILPFYLLAVGLHAGFNWVVLFLPPVEVAGAALQLNFLFAVLIATFAFAMLRAWVRGAR